MTRKLRLFIAAAIVLGAVGAWSCSDGGSTGTDRNAVTHFKSPGEWKIGTDIPLGTYDWARPPAVSGVVCHWLIKGSNGAILKDVYSNPADRGGRANVEPNGATLVADANCGTWDLRAN